MTAYYGNKKIKSVYLGTQNTNCLTHIPNDIKLELDPLNVTVVGSPTVSSGVVSGFSRANYLTLPKTTFPASTSSSWEMVFKFTTNSSVSTRQSIYTEGKGYPSGLGLIDSKVRLTASTSTGSYNIAEIKGKTTLSANTTYWVKGEFTGSVYNLYLSTDGKTYTLENSKTTSTKIADTTNWQIGNDKKDNYPFLGSIDLPNSYIKINGATWWRGGTGKLTLKKNSKVYVPNGWTNYKYYKYTYANWTQPVLTANGTVGGTSYAVRVSTEYTSDGNHRGYRAFDGSKTTQWEANVRNTSQWIEFYSPVELKVSSIDFVNRSSSSTTYTKWKLTVSNDGTNYITIKTFDTGSSSNGASWSVSFDMSKGYKYFKLSVGDSGALTGSDAKPSFAEITFKAKEVTGTIESTANDYDYKVGSGSMVFDEVVTSSDISIATSLTTDSNERTLAVNVTNMNYNTLYTTESGTGYTGTGTCLYYNTTENLVQRYTSGVLQSYRLSLPIARIKADGSVYYGSIEQVFNGMGYIGSTSFILPNVKGLIPYEFNDDGTYKSIEKTTFRVLLKTVNNNNNNTHVAMLTNLGDVNEHTRWLPDSNQDYTSPDVYSRYYNTARNVVRFYNGSKVWSDQTGYMKVADIVCTDGKITSLTPNPVQPEMTGRKISRIYKGSTLVYGYGVNEVIFEKSTSGTATVNIEYDGYYELTVIGGGSGGAFEYSARFADGAAAGGSGAGLIGVAYLSAGSYSVTVGAGGAGAWDNNSREWISASAGGSSSFGSIVTAGGGTAPTARYNGGSQTAGAGGTLTYTSSAFRSTSLAKNGNAGATNKNASTSATYSGGESVYGGYGAGGKAQYGGAYAGGTGYVKVVAI